MIILSAVIFSAAVLPLPAEPVTLGDLVQRALSANSDLAAAEYDLVAEQMKYQSARAGVLPGIGFSSDTGNNPFYRFSDADEFSAETFSSSRYTRHKVGGGLNIGADLPTGGSLSLTGAGNMEFSLADSEDAEWGYLVSPAVSAYLRQPLFIDRINSYPLRFDSISLLNELAAAGAEQSEISRTAFGNNLIIAVTRTSAVLNSLRNTYSLLERRTALDRKRLELALVDEEAGRLSSLDRLSEELRLRRQRELIIELGYQIDSAESSLAQLTGSELPGDGRIIIDAAEPIQNESADPGSSFGVLNSRLAARSIELAATAVQNGSEPVFEVSALYRRSDADTAAEPGLAFEDAGTAGMDLSVSLSLAFPIFDWGERRKQRESDRASLLAAEARVVSALEAAEIASAEALNNLQLIEEKIILLEEGIEYDRTLLERELVRLEAGLSTDAAVETIELDSLERRFSIEQLQDERFLAILELLNTGGVSLEQFFTEVE